MKIILLFAVLFYSLHTVAQTAATQDSIKATINTFFDGMHKKDTTLIRSMTATGITMQTVARNKKGEVRVINDGIDGFLKQVATLPESIKKLEEKITFENILIDTDMAMAWTPFQLYLNDKLYSCGVNHFQLVRIDNIWKINFIIDTRRTKCE